MKCPYCGAENSKVVDSRPAEKKTAIKRRRECLQCNRRFTTYEKVEELQLAVVKKDGTLERFDRDKIRRGILKACEKRPVSATQIEEIVSSIETDLSNSYDMEAPTSVIGEHIMKALKELDDVAYVRFVSVYRQFDTIGAFLNEISKIKNEGKISSESDN